MKYFFIEVLAFFPFAYNLVPMHNKTGIEEIQLWGTVITSGLLAT